MQTQPKICDDQLFIKHFKLFWQKQQQQQKKRLTYAFDACRFLWAILIFVIYTHIIQTIYRWLQIIRNINAYEVMQMAGGAS